VKVGIRELAPTTSVRTVPPQVEAMAEPARLRDQAESVDHRVVPTVARGPMGIGPRDLSVLVGLDPGMIDPHGRLTATQHRGKVVSGTAPMQVVLGALVRLPVTTGNVPDRDAQLRGDLRVQANVLVEKSQPHGVRLVLPVVSVRRVAPIV
jgi:hypothetical protein